MLMSSSSQRRNGMLASGSPENIQWLHFSSLFLLPWVLFQLHASVHLPSAWHWSFLGHVCSLKVGLIVRDCWYFNCIIISLSFLKSYCCICSKLDFKISMLEFAVDTKQYASLNFTKMCTRLSKPIFSPNSGHAVFQDQDVSVTFSWFVINSVTFLLPSCNSLTSPGIPDMWAPCAVLNLYHYCCIWVDVICCVNVSVIVTTSAWCW